jgi:two-component system chemotaxis sensor kinase CheA
LHTLKGNSAVYGLESYSILAHEVEAELATREEGLSGEQKIRLVGAWKDAMQRIGKLLGHTHQGRIEIDRGELEAMMERARAGTPGTELLPVIMQWFAEPVERRLERLSEHACALAQRLGKPPPKIVLAANGIRLDPERWTSYWAEMVHVVRNAVDHGIESPDARVRAGKSEAGTLDVRAWLEGDDLVIKVSDDGAGVNWDAVKRKAAEAGLPHHTRHDLIEALFADGLTTRERSCDTSGRGVGLAALRRVVSGLGGQIQVESEPGGGASFRFQFSAFRGPERAPSPSRVELRSLLPSVA